MKEMVDSLLSLLRILERESLSRGGSLLPPSFWFVILTPVHGDLLRGVAGLDSDALRSSRRKHPAWVLAVLMAFSRVYHGSLSSASLVLSFSPSIDFLFGQKVRSLEVAFSVVVVEFLVDSGGFNCFVWFGGGD
ncbi:hypothetical protein F2Q70_00037595 [Brassica cretica]|uniref:Uncharacterized protein n=1 Tax=Brassica cretica TaxID=69181 RepID=A0A8S9JZZ3_BRACR|nr:hypothetical protein F2Q70_00037595 [Brassica cretica]